MESQAFPFTLLFFILVSCEFQPLQAGQHFSDSVSIGADAVYHRHLTEVDYRSPDEVIVHKIIEVSILNETGRNHSDLKVYYDSDQPIKDIRATLYDAKGKKIKVYKGKDIKDYSIFSESTLFHDHRKKEIKVFYPTYPYRVVFEYTQEYREFIGLPHWFPQVGYKVGVESASYRLIYHKNAPVRYKLFNLPAPVIDSADSELRTITWEVNHLPPVSKESYGSPLHERMKVLLVVPECFSYNKSKGCFTNWGTYGEWVSKLIKPQASASKTMKGNVEELVKDCDDTRDKVRTIYKYMQNHTRYVSIQLGLGGFQPCEAKEVESTGWGDCKALVNYTKTLLQLASIRSHYCEIGVEGKEILFEDFPSAGQTNHVILAVPLREDTLWLECTNQNLPFGYLPYSLQDKKVLWVDEVEETGYLVSTPAPEARRNERKRVIHLSLDEEGNASGSVKTRVRGGEISQLFPELWASPSNQQRIIYDKYPVAGFQLEDYSYLLNETEPTTASEEVQMRVDNYASQTGKRMFLKSHILRNEQDIPEKSTTRRSKLVINRSFVHTDSIIIEMPKGYEVEYLPEGTESQGDFGHFSAQFHVEDRKIIYVKHFTLHRYTGPPEKYNVFIDFLKEAEKSDRKDIILVKKP